ncbi:zeta toxin family protein [Nocardioides salsibiostraticola]
MRLDLVVGPNGAGKTTFTRKILLPALPPGTAFVNADEIAATRWPEDAEARSYDAAQVAAATRVALIASRRPFVAETVFSHPSKLDLVDHAHSEGYTVALHVLLVPEDLTVERVRRRVAAGGHSVPEQKIRERYHRLWPVVARAMESCDTATVYDNSAHRGPRIAAQLTSGVAIGRIGWPSWTPDPLTRRWPPTPSRR